MPIPFKIKFSALVSYITLNFPRVAKSFAALKAEIKFFAVDFF